jgi:hypothetical protein
MTKGLLRVSLLLSVWCLLFSVLGGTGYAGIGAAGIHGQRVIFGAISGDYTTNYYDDSWQQGKDYSYAGPILWRAASTDIINEDYADGTVTLLSEYLLGGECAV